MGRHTQPCAASPQFPIPSCSVTSSTRSRPIPGWLPSFSLFDNLLSPMNNILCGKRVGDKGVADRLDRYLSLTPLDRQTTHIHTPPVCRIVSQCGMLRLSATIVDSALCSRKS